jgi:hypothetical protein
MAGAGNDRFDPGALTVSFNADNWNDAVRIGIEARLRPRPGVWPVDAARLPARTAWIDGYDAKAAAFAACRYVTTVGSGAVDPAVAPVVALHDELCRATVPGLPIA